MYRNIVFSINLPENCRVKATYHGFLYELQIYGGYINLRMQFMKKGHKFMKYVWIYEFSIHFAYIKKIPKTSFHNIQSIQTSENLLIQDTILGVDLFECADHIVVNLDRSTAIRCRKILGFMPNQNEETKILNIISTSTIDQIKMDCLLTVKCKTY